MAKLLGTSLPLNLAMPVAVLRDPLAALAYLMAWLYVKDHRSPMPWFKSAKISPHEILISAAARKVKVAAAAAKPKAATKPKAIAGVKRKAAEKPRLKPAVKVTPEKKAVEKVATAKLRKTPVKKAKK
ncbi:hypothetical protein NL676_037539 [Syzygium grande]|nr:hypothetical protein NL676_037539 [Syzygium grande]